MVVLDEILVYFLSQLRLVTAVSKNNSKYNESSIYFLNLVLIIPTVRFKDERVAIRPSSPQ